MDTKKAVVVLSWGLDSTTLLYKIIKEWYQVEAITFFYGQKHSKEIDMARATCEKLWVSHKLIDVLFLKDLLKSSLTSDEQEVPEWHYEEENMKSTVVPNRNMIFASIAAGYALSIWAKIVALGVHGGDHAIYPDCRADFFEKLNKAIEICDRNNVSLYAPYLVGNKTTILTEWIELWVDYSLTRTCYKWGDKPCWKCWSCRERQEAFEQNNIQDPLLSNS